MEFKILVRLLLVLSLVNLQAYCQVCQKTRRVPINVLKSRRVPYVETKRNWLGQIRHVTKYKMETYTEVPTFESKI